MPGIRSASPTIAAVEFGAGGCIYARVESYAPADDAAHQAICGDLMRRAFDAIRDNPGIQTVVLSARLVETFPGDAAVAPRRLIKGATSAADNLARFVPAVRSIISELQTSGRRVVFLLPIPELPFDPRTCLRLRTVQFQRTECGVSELQAAAKRAKVVEAIEMAAHGQGVQIVDPWPVFCRDGWCSAWVDGGMVYRDDNHLSETGSGRAWAKIANEVLPDA
jgi:hypothetical protein